MDLITHILAGAAVAQLPAEKTLAAAKPSLCAVQRSLIGGVAAAFPDIDYLLFCFNPLEFLAYWHRAETHSFIMAPIWATLLAFVWRKVLPWVSGSPLLFICLLGILSHILLDSFTAYGTQWFAPISREKFSWELLFVVDPYFSFAILICLIGVYYVRQPLYRYAMFLIPAIYLACVFQVKLTLYHRLQNTIGPASSDQPIRIFPQPFSPFYWQVIQFDNQQVRQAYVRLLDDSIARKVTQLFSKANYSAHFRPVIDAVWYQYPLIPDDIYLAAATREVWDHERFTAFRDFAGIPVFLSADLVKNAVNTRVECIWFSDLRYHWPEFTPVFRYGMCRQENDQWQVFRKVYFAEQRRLVK